MLEASVERLLQEVSEDFRAKLFDVQELLSEISLTLKIKFALFSESHVNKDKKILFLEL